MFKKIVLSILIVYTLLFSVPGSAQTETPNAGPVYIIQEGDTLWDIAIRFGVTVDAIMAVNNMTSQNIFPGKGRS